MCIQHEIDKLEYRCAINQYQTSPVIFAVFGTEDEVFLVSCASTSQKILVGIRAIDEFYKQLRVLRSTIECMTK